MATSLRSDSVSRVVERQRRAAARRDAVLAAASGNERRQQARKRRRRRGEASLLRDEVQRNLRIHATIFRGSVRGRAENLRHARREAGIAQSDSRSRWRYRPGRSASHLERDHDACPRAVRWFAARARSSHGGARRAPAAATGTAELRSVHSADRTRHRRSRPPSSSPCSARPRRPAFRARVEAGGGGGSSRTGAPRRRKVAARPSLEVLPACCPRASRTRGRPSRAAWRRLPRRTASSCSSAAGASIDSREVGWSTCGTREDGRPRDYTFALGQERAGSAREPSAFSASRWRCRYLPSCGGLARKVRQCFRGFLARGARAPARLRGPGTHPPPRSSSSTASASRAQGGSQSTRSKTPAATSCARACSTRIGKTSARSRARNRTRSDEGTRGPGAAIPRRRRAVPRARAPRARARRSRRRDRARRTRTHSRGC